MRGLKGKRIVIAGGTAGIGAATAERLSEEGASVVIGGRNLEAGQVLAKRLNEAGGKVIAVKFDLGDESSVEALIDTAATELGGIDGLFNVGAELSAEHLARDTNLLEMDVAVWRRTFEVNLFGYAIASRAVIPHLLAQGGGAIVNTSSDSAWIGETTRPAYGASKAAINSLARHISSAWGKQGIRANTLGVGVTMTETAQEQIGAEWQASILATVRGPRLGKPADVAAAAAFLLSDDAEWVTGQAWSVDGGMTIRD
ncbi:NAD(P)-dependent dehydrogenase (short-subunit alcohol dehydrogenase family) [Kibdelosporangium banguiense]|uniref:NAD(P)-dependent dehydrogenase (Short-subunit alcohol dehydrogenase family) n=1 Tax=Kibdelosporangium banguiense TaxID=1365924 RepID=A0ABS4TT33_9PSEU|nr:SDR family oxidoreductase [Kibdelosporangium banguiense]MBP2327098.1 NAD(P)-dependent dehydrogenase (short-subunit alcohol dehydrogenase family) [Kibdelosporangium banguiense]